MYYDVTFYKALGVEANSEKEAARLAAEIISDDPTFYVAETTESEEED